MAVSLRIPDEVKRRIAKLAKARDTTAHAFMIEAIRDKLQAEETQAAFYAEARDRLARMKKTGRGIPVEEVFNYLTRRGQGKTAARPKTRKIR